MSAPRSCNELGVCQSRQPACKGCFVFAPGVIEGGGRRRWLADHRVEQLARAALALALLATLAATLGFAAGYLGLGGVL